MSPSEFESALPAPSGSDSAGSTTHLFQLVTAGDPEAERKLFQRFFEIVVRLVDQKLGPLPRRIADEEDVALNVMQDALSGLRNQRFRDLHDREDFWQIIWDLIHKRTTDLKRELFRQKQDIRRETSALVVSTGSDSSVHAGEIVPSDEFDDPEFIIHETRDLLIATLDDAELREIARRRCDGQTCAEIAHELQKTVSRVEFLWKVVRAKWITELRRRGELG